MIELGRQQKYKTNAWHQYILSVDIEEIETPFLAIELKNGEIINKFNLTLKEIKAKKWYSFLKIIKKTPLFLYLQNTKNSILLPDDFINSIQENTAKITDLQGNWVSIEETKPLNFDSNFSNWINAEASTGYFYFLVNTFENNQTALKIPIKDVSGAEGHYAIYLGKSQITYTQILIWQNDTFPVVIPYKYENNNLILIFGKKEIIFRKNNYFL